MARSYKCVIDLADCAAVLQKFLLIPAVFGLMTCHNLHRLIDCFASCLHVLASSVTPTGDAASSWVHTPAMTSFLDASWFTLPYKVISV